MAVIVTVLAYTLQLAALLFLPALLYLCLRTHTGKKAADMAALLCATVIFVGAVWLAFHPIRSCPKELESYMTEDRWQDILSVTPPIYNAHLPFFRVESSLNALMKANYTGEQTGSRQAPPARASHRMDMIRYMV